MELSSDVADPFDQRGFNVHMNVFEFGAERQPAEFNLPADFVEVGDNLLTFFGRDEPAVSQHLCVSLRCPNVDVCQPFIKADRFGEGFDQRVGLLPESACPRFCGHDCRSFDIQVTAQTG